MGRQKFDDEMHAANERDRAAGIYRTWGAIASEVLHCTGKAHGRPEPCPDVPLELLHVEVAHGRFATDGNGRALGSEMDRYFRDYRVRDRGMREAYELLWRGMDAEASRVRAEEMERIQKGRER